MHRSNLVNLHPDDARWFLMVSTPHQCPDTVESKNNFYAMSKMDGPREVVVTCTDTLEQYIRRDIVATSSHTSDNSSDYNG